jgi:putative hydrolase of HD superfamily
VNKKYVTANEEKAISDLAKTIPFGADIQAIIQEFNQCETKEAMLAHDADQLELILMLKEYKDLGNRYADEWISFALKRLRTEKAQLLATAILETDSTSWWFTDKSDWWINGGNPRGK